MSVYYPGCALVIPDPICSDCPTKELGRVRSIFLKSVSYTFLDITDPTEWATAIQNRDVYVFPYTKGTFTMNEVLTQGFGNVDEDVDSYQCELAVMEPNFAGNCDFWNAIKNSHSYEVGWRSQTKIYLSEVAATIIPKFNIEDDLKSKIVWNIMLKFIQENLPCPLDMPVDTFDRCISPST